MKLFLRAAAAVVLTTAVVGCKSFLDINANPNNATSETPDAILGVALANTAANYTGGAVVGANDNYNSLNSFTAAYWSKSGTVSGFSPERTYNYSNTYNQFLWNLTYDNLNDYQIIQTNGTTSGYPNHAAIARIMKVYNFLLLVDEYGDIPYTNALKGIANTAPTYDKAADIYKDFIVQLKGAITDIDAAATLKNPSARGVGPEDILFKGDMTKWKQFANSLRLRVLLRESQTNDAGLNTYVATEMKAVQADANGFISADVVAQPGYATNTNQQNPFYNRYGFGVGLTRATTEYSFIIPTNYIISQYISNDDSARIAQLYRVGMKDSVRAYLGGTLGERTAPQFDPTTPNVGSRFLQGGTFLKGPNAPTVLMLLSEQLFSKAEAETRNLFTGGEAAAKTDYLDGIKSSFITTFRAATVPPASLAASGSAPGAAQYDAYILNNAKNAKVNYDLASPTGNLGKQYVILYQKYLAENTIASTEAWDDYRRAAQPKIPASLQSNSPRPDKLPTRLLYPLSESSTNGANVPTGVTQFTPIFWDVVD
jgi:hypothetical protein